MSLRSVASPGRAWAELEDKDGGSELTSKRHIVPSTPTHELHEFDLTALFGKKV